MHRNGTLFLPPKLYMTQHHHAPNMRNEMCVPVELKNELNQQQQQQQRKTGVGQILYFEVPMSFS